MPNLSIAQRAHVHAKALETRMQVPKDWCVLELDVLASMEDAITVDAVKGLMSDRSQDDTMH